MQNEHYQDNGYNDRRDYLKSLASEYNIPLANVYALAELLGPDEDFDGLVTMIEDASEELL